MTVERIEIPALRYVDERGVTMHRIPLRDPGDSTWWVLDEDGCTVWADGAAVRAFADEWDTDPARGVDEDGAIESLRALADLLDELDDPIWQPAPGSTVSP